MPLYKVDWKKVWPETGKIGDDGTLNPALYSPALKIDKIKEIELATVERCFEFPSPKSNVLYFCRDVGMEVGASDGKLTQWVLVKYTKVGQKAIAHGQPMTVRELRKKGAIIP